MQHRVLIFAPETDPHAAAVAWALAQQGVVVVLEPSLPARQDVHYAFHIDAAHEYLAGSIVDADRVSAVWNRRLHDPEPRCAEADRAFASWEWKMFQRNLFGLADAFAGALWVNRLAAAQQAENKLVQLSVCRRLGLPFPETLVTTDAERVDALRRQWGRIVFKSFFVRQWEDRQSGKKHAVGVTLLDEHSDLPADSIAICPGIYQRYIEKSFDVRVTVIGKHFFAVSLRRVSGGAFVDWRPHGMSTELAAEAITLPSIVEGKLRAFMHELGLVFGCIDLAVDRNGDFYFLEVNQAGQFLFVEDLLPGCQVLQAMTALLASGRADFAIDTASPVSMAGFRQSDAYAELEEKVGAREPDRQLFSLE
jgi:glutathione synthase/RimK-type ligase-like ATP-grasp enzyme